MVELGTVLGNSFDEAFSPSVFIFLLSLFSFNTHPSYYIISLGCIKSVCVYHIFFFRLFFFSIIVLENFWVAHSKPHAQLLLLLPVIYIYMYHIESLISLSTNKHTHVQPWVDSYHRSMYICTNRGQVYKQ